MVTVWKSEHLATIDRGTIGPTRIGAWSKFDDLVMIAHNCQIGRSNGLAGLARRTYVVLTGQAGIATISTSVRVPI